MSKSILEGEFHKVTADIKKVLLSDKELLEKWNSLTPLARNEWICWVTIPKKEETKIEHLKRLKEDIVIKGKKRPCCWPGCPHINNNAKKWFK